ncbi:hypothetical protein OSB04_026129 [Centaurea solstitialis]|uniref:Late embryogenesis abundant protein LEA-2 subgroup domain-containing protein n=1 Tax=Centaurea solstitialis TaxID=347529 RepID=A0AA38SC52_9ASTR|nr:hypothetical protein OSB04_026129 [Centaurea solstitialis]
MVPNNPYAHVNEDLSAVTNEARRKRRRRCLTSLVIAAVFIVGIIFLFSLTAGRFRTPRFRVRSATFGTFNVANSTTTPSFDIVMNTELGIRNRNFRRFRYRRTIVDFYYRDRKIGEGSVWNDDVKARDTRKFNVPVILSSTNVSSVSELRDDFNRGVLPLRSRSRLTGKFKILVVFRKYKHVNMDCSMELVVAKMESTTVVLYPSPEMGHLVPMVEFGKLIHTHHPSISIVMIITPAPSNTGSTSTGKYIDATAAANPFITFRHLPTVPLTPELSSHGFMDLFFEIPELYNPKLHDALVAISAESIVKCIVLDFFTTAAFQVSKTLGLPTYYFFTSGASGLCHFLYLPTLRKTVPDNFHALDIYVDVPGIPPIHISDLPPGSMFDKHIVNAASDIAESSGIIVNSFVGFEERAVETVRDGKCIPDRPTPPVYVIGPLIEEAGPGENECLKWLDSQPSKSVVFLCFGSRGVFKREQMKEIAIGLEKSGQRFLWVVRDPPPGDENESSSGEFDLEGFVARTVGKGMVVKNWALQTAILGHDSVGGFVSHCGWNSALEAVVSGVPMVAWPLYSEQKMIRVFLVQELKVAVAVRMAADGFVMAEAVEEAVGELMEGEGGRTVRERVSEMSGKAKVAVEEGGTSHVDLYKLTKSWGCHVSKG